MSTQETSIVDRRSAAGFRRILPSLPGRPPTPDRMLSPYATLSETIASFPHDQKTNITTAVVELQSTPRNQRKKVLETVDKLVEPMSLSAFRAQIDYYTHARLSEVPECFRTPLAIKIFDAMVTDPESYQQQIAVYTSIASARDLSVTSRERLHIRETKERFSQNRGHSTAELCKEAEEKLEASMGNKSVVAVNDKFLVKFNGKFIGLCTDTFSTPTGDIFLAGNWYKPFSGQLRTQLKEAYLQGYAKIHVEEGAWTLLRAADPNGALSVPNLVKTAQEHIAMAPDRLPDIIGGLSRQEYWEKTRELFPKA